MSIITTKHLKYKVKIKDENNEIIGYKTILDDINIDIKKGEFIAVLGHNGSGKSTFARHLNALLIPSEGSVWINGQDTSAVSELWRIRKQCGMVFQNPDNQIVGVTVEEDVAFGPENLGIKCDEMTETVEQSLEKVDMLKFRGKSPNHLSGGQKQRVAIAASLAMKPECIVLDEPTAMLDPQGRQDVMRIVSQLNKEEHMTIILITHHMEEAALADKILIMDKGRPVMSGTPREVFCNIDRIRELRLELPQIMQLSHELYLRGKLSRYDILSVDEFARQYKEDSPALEGNLALEGNPVLEDNPALEGNPVLERNRLDNSDFKGNIEKNSSAYEEILQLKNVSYVYEAGTSMEVRAVDDVTVALSKGEFVGIIGHTGSGKSTLIQIMNGLIKPSFGEVYFKGKDIKSKGFNKRQLHFSVGLVFQYPESQLFEETIIKDVMYGPLNKGVEVDEAERLAKASLCAIGFREEDFDKSPFDLSGGEMRKAAIAGVIAMEPDIIILDEPTAGLDPAARTSLLDSLKELREEKGKTVVIVSHSMEDIANYADRLIVIDSGQIKYDDTTKRVFGNVGELEKMGLAVPKVTQAMKVLRGMGYAVGENILTVNEAVSELCDY